MANERLALQDTSGSSPSPQGTDGPGVGELVASQRDLRQIVDSIPALVLTCAPGGEIEFINRQGLEYFGRTFEELQAWQQGDLVHPEDLDRVRLAWQNDIESGKEHCAEHRLRRFDGVYRWFQRRASPLHDTDGRLLRWFVVLTDIEDLKLAEDAARNAQQASKQLLDSMPAFVFTTKPKGELDWVNRTILGYFGRSLSELEEWQMTDSVHPDDVPSTIEYWTRGVQSGELYDFEQRLRRFDGVYRWFHFRAAPLRDEQGQLVGWCGLVTDIDDLHRAKEAARLNERNLRVLVDSVPGLVYTMTPDCELGIVNRQLLQYFGKTLEELQDWERAGCVHPSDLPRVRASLQRTIEHGEPHEVEQRLRGADGVYRWFKPRGLPERDAEGRIVRWYCLLNDIDDLKRAEEKQRSLQMRLSRASQVATISEFAATIAHEVNQPVASVMTSADACRAWLSASPPNVQRALRCLERISRDGRSAGEVIARVRSLFRHAPPVKLPLNLNEVIAEVCHLMADDLRDKGVALKVELQPNLPLVLADRVQMQQVLVNLTRNGIEAMEGLPPGARHLSIASFELDDEVTVEVTDEGPGVTDPDAVFEPFYTTKASGMGMGLAICRSILEAHGGRLRATTNAAHGATFDLVLRAFGSGAQTREHANE